MDVVGVNGVIQSNSILGVDVAFKDIMLLLIQTTVGEATGIVVSVVTTTVPDTEHVLIVLSATYEYVPAAVAVTTVVVPEITPEGPLQDVLVFVFVGAKVKVVLGEAHVTNNEGLLLNVYKGAPENGLTEKVVKAVQPASSVTDTV